MAAPCHHRSCSWQAVSNFDKSPRHDCGHDAYRVGGTCAKAQRQHEQHGQCTAHCSCGIARGFGYQPGLVDKGDGASAKQNNVRVVWRVGWLRVVLAVCPLERIQVGLLKLLHRAMARWRSPLHLVMAHLKGKAVICNTGSWTWEEDVTVRRAPVQMHIMIHVRALSLKPLQSVEAEKALRDKQ